MNREHFQLQTDLRIRMSTLIVQLNLLLFEAAKSKTGVDLEVQHVQRKKGEDPVLFLNYHVHVGD